MTNGTSWEISDESKLVGTLLEVFSSNLLVRSRLMLTIAESGKTFSMSSTCTACN